MKQSLAAAFLAALISFTAHAQQAGMRAQVMIVESLTDFERWAEQRLTEGTYPRALREVPVGIPVHFPIVVSGLQPTPGELSLVADIEFYAPSGNSLGVIQKCCRFTAPPNSGVRAAVLGNAATLVFAANDMRGTYTVAISVTDGSRTVKSRQEFNFGKPEPAPAPEKAAPKAQATPPPPKASPAPAPPKQQAAPTPPKSQAAPPPPKPQPAPPAPAEPAPAAPKLRMAPPPEKNPGGNADKRDCLSLPTPQEVIKCAERK